MVLPQGAALDEDGSDAESQIVRGEGLPGGYDGERAETPARSRPGALGVSAWAWRADTPARPCRVEQQIANTRNRLEIRSSSVLTHPSGRPHTGYRITSARRNPSALVQPVRMNGKFQLDSREVAPSREAAMRLFDMCHDEKSRLFHVAPDTVGYARGRTPEITPNLAQPINQHEYEAMLKTREYQQLQRETVARNEDKLAKTIRLSRVAVEQPRDEMGSGVENRLGRDSYTGKLNADVRSRSSGNLSTGGREGIGALSMGRKGESDDLKVRPGKRTLHLWCLTIQRPQYCFARHYDLERVHRRIVVRTPEKSGRSFCTKRSGSTRIAKRD